MNIQEKYERLKEILKGYKRILVAFSGGVDSTLLLKVAQEVLGNNIVAITAEANIHSIEEIEQSKKFAKKIGVEFITVHIDPIRSIDGFRNNPEDRCYMCKRAIFSKFLQYAENMDIYYIVDGTNADDLGDYRPGLKALSELNIKSPLLEAGFTKADVRELSKILNLETYDKPSNPCLATRIPYGKEITDKKLRQIDKSEMYIKSLGIKVVRVRHHEDTARIEVMKEDFESIIKNSDKIYDTLREYGFKFVSLDLSGYKTGSMNIEVKDEAESGYRKITFKC